MQKEYNDHRYFWFIDQVREYILALEDDQDTSPPSEGRKKSVLNAAQTSSGGGSSSTDDLCQMRGDLQARCERRCHHYQGGDSFSRQKQLQQGGRAAV
jgi:hypothetical protein